MKYVTRVRPATVFPFVLGVFSGTLITVFLFLSVRSIEELEAEPPGVEAREGRANAHSKLSAHDHERESQALGTLTNIRKKVVFHRRKAVLYNVLTHSMQAESRGIAIHKTWASETKFKNHVNFYLLSPTQTEEGILKKKVHITPLAMKEGDTTYGDNYQGIFELWRDVCERKLNDYHWFVKLKDTVYLQADKLEKLLTSLNSSEPILVGRSVTPADYERNELGLRVGESYCFEGGYAVSWRALDLVCPHLSACKEGAKSENEDVEMARCIRKYTGVNCTASTEV
jgi:chondroitin sulfate synthase